MKVALLKVPGKAVVGSIGRLAVAALAATLLATGTAHAAPSDSRLGAPALDGAEHWLLGIRVAEEAFPTVPCGQAIYRRLPDLHLRGRGASPEKRYDGVALVEACQVEIEASRHLDFLRLCSTLVHERGHLAGLDDSPDPRSVMHSPIERPYWRCRREARRWPG